MRTNTNGPTPTPSPTTTTVSAISSIMLPDTFAAISAAKITTTVEITRPSPKSWVMAHSTDVVPRVAIVTMPEERGSGVYVIQSDMLKHVPALDITVAALHRGVDIDGTEFLWLAREGEDTWASSMKEAIKIAMGSWVRVQSDRQTSRYVTATPKGELPAPVWSDKPFAELVELAIRERTIDSPSHPVIKLLEGVR